MTNVTVHYAGRMDSYTCDSQIQVWTVISTYKRIPECQMIRVTAMGRVLAMHKRMDATNWHIFRYNWK